MTRLLVREMGNCQTGVCEVHNSEDCGRETLERGADPTLTGLQKTAVGSGPTRPDPGLVFTATSHAARARVISQHIIRVIPPAGEHHPSLAADEPSRTGG